MKLNEIDIIEGKKYIVEYSDGRQFDIFQVYLGDLWNPIEKEFIYECCTLKEMLTFEYFEYK